ncbi:hypothetical protein GUJ93_ZPchr0597g2917 [Zizania palustris]|uniref:Major facilitator superfamily (MFS) profile domain-containing protein n=1 Tax=Zizania palustris TaxID=103762 RepID=A0A8J5R6I4_ZIZPA|nr:hypothetical protein GUJ93_ZPchr0597g2917 [Zizania palustris]
MAEAKKVLQKLRGRVDVSGEMALLVEGLEVGGDTSIEEYIIGPATEPADDHVADGDKDQITLYGPGEGQSWIARPSKGPSILGSMLSLTSHQHPKIEQWDEENLHRDDEEYASDGAGDDYEDNAHSPLLSRQTTSAEGKDIAHHGHRGSALKRESEDGKKEGGFKRIYLHQEGVPGSRKGSVVSLPGGGDVPEGGDFIHAAALVSQPALYSKDLMEQCMAGPAMVHPSDAAAKGPSWKDLLEPGVRRALLVGVGIQILQQFAGINGVLYYTPQILEQAGVAVLLSNLGLSSASASILISSLTTLLMLPSIGLAMRLMDISGRRFLLGTIPVLIASLIVLVVSNVIDLGTVPHAALSTISVIVYFCCFVMGFGPIPNILCSEIFPTRVRGICMPSAHWHSDLPQTLILPARPIPGPVACSPGAHPRRPPDRSPLARRGDAHRLPCHRPAALTTPGSVF